MVATDEAMRAIPMKLICTIMPVWAREAYTEVADLNRTLTATKVDGVGRRLMI
jgi:hypothetical protein